MAQHRGTPGSSYILPGALQLDSRTVTSLPPLLVTSLCRSVCWWRPLQMGCWLIHASAHRPIHQRVLGLGGTSRSFVPILRVVIFLHTSFVLSFAYRFTTLPAFGPSLGPSFVPSFAFCLLPSRASFAFFLHVHIIDMLSFGMNSRSKRISDSSLSILRRKPLRTGQVVDRPLSRSQHIGMEEAARRRYESTPPAEF